MWHTSDQGAGERDHLRDAHHVDAERRRAQPPVLRGDGLARLRAPTRISAALLACAEGIVTAVWMGVLSGRRTNRRPSSPPACVCSQAQEAANFADGAPRPRKLPMAHHILMVNL